MAQVNIAVAGPAPGQNTVSSKQKLRDRPLCETELCTWEKAPLQFRNPSAHTSDLASPQQVRLRSLQSVSESSIIFCNNSGRPARAVWLNFAGHEIAYSVIEPGQKKKYRTYRTHPWIMRDAETGHRLMLGTRMVIFAQDQEVSVSITEPPFLAWSLNTHKHFPETFRATVRALLLTHQSSLHSSGPAHGLSYSMTQDMEVTVSPVTAEKLPQPSTATVRLFADATGSPVHMNAAASQHQADVQMLANASPPRMHYPCNEDGMPSSPTVGNILLRGLAKAAQQAGKLLPLIGLKRSPGKHFRPGSPPGSPTSSSAVSLSQADTVRISSRHLAALPADLVRHIISFMAPEHRQHISFVPSGHPDILPALVPSDPATWEPVSKEQLAV
mmetsp:Transcript_666/g.1518  ORF Transcript_666/g.1518 Transcript_666/m.1518 type:complete len:386 (-) Transcript_666:936-2093(-)